MPHPLIAALRAELRRRADPSKAPAMRAYMKSSMPYLGVMSAAQGQIHRELFPRYPIDGFAAWKDVSLSLWRGAAYREERYAAIALLGHRLYAEHRTLKALPIYEEFIVTGAWWDYVDTIASHRLGELMLRHPAAMKRRMLAWVRSKEMWKRRAAILCQLRMKGETDLDLLYRLILATAHEEEFFIRKAIGWALREYAWTDPDEVVRFVSRHVDRLSSLSKREALKNVPRRGKGISVG